MNRTETGVSAHKEGYNCAQSVLVAFAEEFNLDKETALKISCGFGAGMGRLQQTCGAVTGAYMVIGLKHGRCKQEDAKAKETTYALVQKFNEKFQEKNKTTCCKELIECDLLTYEGQLYFNKYNLIERVCENLIKDAIKILEEIL